MSSERKSTVPQCSRCFHRRSGLRVVLFEAVKRIRVAFRRPKLELSLKCLVVNISSKTLVFSINSLEEWMYAGLTEQLISGGGQSVSRGLCLAMGSILLCYSAARYSSHNFNFLGSCVVPLESRLLDHKLSCLRRLFATIPSNTALISGLIHYEPLYSADLSGLSTRHDLRALTSFDTIGFDDKSLS